MLADRVLPVFMLSDWILVFDLCPKLQADDFLEPVHVNRFGLPHFPAVFHIVGGALEHFGHGKEDRCWIQNHTKSELKKFRRRQPRRFAASFQDAHRQG